MVFNTSTNFLLYCFFGQKFREVLVGFTLRIIFNRTRQSNSQIGIRRLSEKEQQIPVALSSQQQRISTGNSSIITDDLQIKINNSTREILNKTSIQNPEESSSLITNSEQILTINEDPSLKVDQKVNLYTYANGKRLLVLKI
jgi:hypothetical protein